LTHKIVAKKGAASAKGPARCDDTTIFFFDPLNSSKIIQTVWAKVAYYDATEARVYGADEVKMTSSELDLTATGFVMELKTSRLTLEHEVVARGELADLFCQSAVVTLFKEKIATNERLAQIERLEATGDVRFVNKKPGKQQWDEILSKSAVYEGKTGMLTFPNGGRALLQGKEVGSAKEGEYRIRE